MLNKDFKEFIVLLNEKKVEYLLVGGYAVILHGYSRFTGDLDIWVKPENNNAKKILEVLRDFGFSSLELDVEDFTKEDKIVQLGYQPLRIDLITSVTGISFEECYESAVYFTIDDISVRTINKEHLKKNKRASGRHKDLDDLEHL